MKSTQDGPRSGRGAQNGLGSRRKEAGGKRRVVYGAAWALVLFAAGIALCVTPLFNILGYESCLVLALLGSLAAVRQGALLAVRGHEQKDTVRGRVYPRSGGAAFAGGGASSREEVGAPGPLGRALLLYLRGLLAAEALLILPLACLLLNGLRVRNCSLLAGLQFFAMMPVLSVACATAVGFACGSFAATYRRALVCGYAVIAFSILWSVLRFYTTPAIFAYDPFFGYFPGALYDEEVAIGPAFFAARALHALFALFLVVISAWRFTASADRDGEATAQRGRRARRGLFVLGLLLFAAAAALYFRGGRLGIYADAASLDRRLPLERRTAHFVLRYRPGGAVARDIELYAREHELRYAQLRELLGVEPDFAPHFLLALLDPSMRSAKKGVPIVKSYLFESAEEKREAMGASHTYIAKPWRRELYLQHEAWPHPVLRHELAHVFAGAAGDRLLRLSLRHGLPQPGMIEGLAVAADFRPQGELDSHQAVLAMRRARLEPPLSQVFGQGFFGLSFYKLPAGRAYTIAGSFCRYLLDRYGAAPLLSAYLRGGGPAGFSAALGVPFQTLEAEWSRFIDEQPLKPASQEVAREQLRRKAVFHRVCAHELALRKQAAKKALARGDRDAAISLLNTICRDDPDEPQHLAELLELRYEAAPAAEVQKTAEALLHHPQVTPVLLTRTQARLGDLAVRRGDLAAARDFYEQAQKGPDSEAAARLLTAKLTALSAPQAGPLLLRVLVGGPDKSATAGRDGAVLERKSDAVSVYLLLQAIAAEPNLGLGHYILGRMLYERGGYAEAEKELARSQELGLPDGRFEEQALLLRGEAALLDGRASEAEALFTQLYGRLAPSELGKKLEIADLRDRAHRWPELLAGDGTSLANSR